MTDTAARLIPYRRLVERADQNRWLRWGVYALVVLSPVLMLLLTSVVLRVDIRDIVPFNSDGIFYWHQAKTFGEVGFGGGYYTYGEVPPRMESIPFYVWGPFTPIFYGLLGRVFGWYPESIVVINMGLLMAGLGLFLYAGRPSWWKAALVPLVLGSTMTFWLYQSASMVVMLHYAIAVMLAACFFRLLQNDDRRDLRGWWVGTLVLIILASLMIPIWAPISIVYFLLAFRGRGWRWTVAAVMAGMLFFAAATLINVLTSAPYPTTIPPFLTSLPEDVGGALRGWVDMLSANLSVFFNDQWLSNSMMRAGAFIIVVVAAWHLFRFWSRERQLQLRQTPSLSFDWSLHIANLLPILLIYVTIYYQFWHMFRQLAPRMVIASLFLLMFGRFRLLLIVVVSGVIGIIPTREFVLSNIADNINTSSSAAYDQWRDDIRQVLVHLPDAPSRWCNSLVVSEYYFNSPQLGILMAVPGGIGLSVEGPAVPQRTRYGLIDETTYREHGEEANLMLLMEVPGGGLYLNLDSDCPLPPDDVLERARNAGA